MKLKIMRRENDIILDYFRIGDMHAFRLKALEHIVSGTDGGIVLYIDTNSRSKTTPVSSIENHMKDCGVEYAIEPIESSRRGILGFKSFLKTSKKNGKLPEHIIVAKLSKETPLNGLYNGVLLNFDYALGIGSDKELGELLIRLKMDAADVLFNRNVFKNTVYDSIVARRIRMDAPYGLLENFAEKTGPAF
ncbi:MAG: hypothetical protein R3232_03510 [Clostridia bacterium]|nr:hypothetical protein [Clostridia bacterium]